jgi:hypothetical protein
MPQGGEFVALSSYRGMPASQTSASVDQVYRDGGTLASMATKNPRIQVTVDRALAAALAEVDPHPKSKSRLIRDLALRGAEVAREDRRRREEARKFFLKVARGEIELDMTGAREAWEEREAEVE